jgi:putative transposase
MVRLGVWYHITARGIERRSIFKDDRDRFHFLGLLSELSEQFHVRLYAYVLMDNHYHLLIELREPNLSQAMRWLNISYSVWFNRRHARAGYLFQGRFKSILVDPATRGYSLSAYIHLNPVRTARHGLSKTDLQHDRAGVGAAPAAKQARARLAQLRAFRGSSYRAFIGSATAPKWLEADAVLEKGGGAKAQRRAAYRKYVEDQVKQGRIDTPWEELQDRVILGAADFITALKKQARAALKKGETCGWPRERAPLESILQAIERAKNEKWDEFKDRYGDGGLALALTMARKYAGLTLAETSRRLGLAPGVNISLTIQRYRQRLRQDRSERRIAAIADKMINETI